MNIEIIDIYSYHDTINFNFEHHYFLYLRILVFILLFNLCFCIFEIWTCPSKTSLGKRYFTSHVSYLTSSHNTLSLSLSLSTAHIYTTHPSFAFLLSLLSLLFLLSLLSLLSLLPLLPLLSLPSLPFLFSPSSLLFLPFLFFLHSLLSLPPIQTRHLIG